MKFSIARQGSITFAVCLILKPIRYFWHVKGWKFIERSFKHFTRTIHKHFQISSQMIRKKKTFELESSKHQLCTCFTMVKKIYIIDTRLQLPMGKCPNGMNCYVLQAQKSIEEMKMPPICFKVTSNDVMQNPLFLSLRYAFFLPFLMSVRAHLSRKKDRQRFYHILDFGMGLFLQFNAFCVAKVFKR